MCPRTSPVPWGSHLQALLGHPNPPALESPDLLPCTRRLLSGKITESPGGQHCFPEQPVSRHWKDPEYCQTSEVRRHSQGQRAAIFAQCSQDQDPETWVRSYKFFRNSDLGLPRLSPKDTLKGPQGHCGRGHLCAVWCHRTLFSPEKNHILNQPQHAGVGKTSVGTEKFKHMHV